MSVLATMTKGTTLQETIRDRNDQTIAEKLADFYLGLHELVHGPLTEDEVDALIDKGGKESVAYWTSSDFGAGDRFVIATHLGLIK